MSANEPFDAYALTSDAIEAAPQRLWPALRKIGPGIILAASIVGSGELILTTSLGAKYGFVFLWLILFSCVIKVFVQLELGRYAISSGKPTLAALNDLPGLRLGAHWIVWWWFIMLLATVFQLGAMVGGVGQALNLAFPRVSEWIAERFATAWPAASNTIYERPEYPWAVLTAAAAIALLLSGGYRRVERVSAFLVAGVTLLTVICVLLLPSLGYPIGADDLRQGFSLDFAFLDYAAIAAAFSAFGITGVGASELFAYPYWCVEKGYCRFAGPNANDRAWTERARGWMRVMYLDAWVSMAVFTLATVAFYILGATVLHRKGLNPEGAQMIETLSEMYLPLGTWVKILFLIGAGAVLFKTLYVSSASNSRLSADFLGLTRVVRYTQPGERSRWINRFCVFFPALALVLYFWLGQPRLMVTIGGLAQAATLPLLSGVALFFRYRRTDRRLAPSLAWDVCLWVAFLSITTVALYFLISPLVQALSD
jgi:Mn2+/Fe2+ NRAMP family transporter